GLSCSEANQGGDALDTGGGAGVGGAPLGSGGAGTGGLDAETGGAANAGGATNAVGGHNGGGSASGGTASGGTASGPTDYERPPSADFTEDRVPGVTFDMVYVAGGTFTLGCEVEPCPADTAPVPGVTVSGYHLGKTEITAEVWSAVMGGEPGFGGPTMTWYDAMSFACELGKLTQRAYRMMTEAEFEYAAKHHPSQLDDLGSGEEWAYNSWSLTHTGGTDPVGPGSGEHTQKTRRDAQGSVDNIT